MGLFSERPGVSTAPRLVSHAPINSVASAPINRYSRAGRAALRPSVAQPPAAESSSSRRFGELLVSDGLITQDQLDAALRLQMVARAYVPIGQVLLANKLITRKKLNALLHRYGKRSRLGAI